MKKVILHGFNVPRWVIVLSMTAEYGLLFFDPISPVRSIMMVIGVFLLFWIVACNGQWRFVHLRYEQETGIIIKTVFTDTIILLYQLAYIYDSDADMTAFFVRIGLMLLIHLATIFIFCLCKHIIRKKAEADNYLYIVDSNFPDGVEEEKIISVHADRALIFDRMCGSDYIYLYDISPADRDFFLKKCFELRKKVFYSARISDAQLRISHLAQDGDKPVLFSELYTIGGAQRVIKRLLDIVCCSVGLILLCPLFLLIAVCIKLEDGGTIFYRQIRCTENMREFSMLKFRSMVMNAEQSTGTTLSEQCDPRLTKTGAVIRRLKLDELPQLINIIRGDMSIVGPRPERPELIRETLKEMPEFCFRNSIKAGLTGYAQVHGDYYTSFYDKLKWDLLYIENFSLILDLKIILMTIPAVIRGSGDMKKKERSVRGEGTAG